MYEIPFHKPTINDNELRQISQLLNKPNNSIVENFEDNIKKFIGVSYAISVNNSTSALQLALSTMDLKRGDKILMSINSFPNIPEVVRHFDAEPLFVDINLDDMNIDLNKLEQYLKTNNNKKLKGAIITFVAGQIVDLDRLYDIKNRYNITLIEDASDALGASYNGKKIGSLEADMTILSFNTSYTKTQLNNTAVLVTNNQNFAIRAKLLRTHGISTTYDEFGKMDNIYDVLELGHQYNISQLEASFSIAQLQKIDSNIKRQYEIASLYLQGLLSTKHIKIPKITNEHIWNKFIISIDKNRDSFAKALKDFGICTAIHYIPLHLLTYYKTKYNIKITTYLNALSSYGQILSLPIYPTLSDNDVKYIIKKIIELDKNWV